MTSHLDPSIQGFVESCSQRQPCFSVPASNIQIMQQPREFYKCLLDMISRAENNIFLSSLYIGSKEGELVESLHRALDTKPTLRIHLLLDYNRSTRPGSDSTARILLPLLKEFPDRICVSLFRSPKLKGLMAKLVPPRFNEGWGTWHPKIYGVDTEVMLSGANLNESYFTNRQDRYIHFNQPSLAKYCQEFLRASSAFTYRLIPDASTSEGYRTHWSQSAVHPQRMEPLVQSILSDFQLRWRKQSLEALDLQRDSASGATDNTLIMPVIQGGQFGLHEEEEALSSLFEGLAQYRKNSSSSSKAYNGPLIDFTTGYFGIYSEYCKLIIQSSLRYRIICSSPKANGFYGSKGVSGRLPEGYTLLEQRFMRQVRQAGLEWLHDHETCLEGPAVQLNEWEREGWTYHAKGVWLRPNPSADPCLTLFGSTNLNSRSANLDTELSFILATGSSDLRRRLGSEVDGLREHSHAWHGAERRVRLGTKALVGLVGGFL
ncbi:hypothetical protein BDY19DRAFT_982650 [Irpex rosettiformis]|uniref:Uncharacterized protein n=1 Tax=Irpex rosettiformis TaxID=378272 RepID=A0ACB8UI57_9APHY|nr:hypothetical protein BDY19DRAFT_982650 [Irpex rosettiformis]